MSEEIRAGIRKAVEELKDAPETLVEALPDIMYISDVSQEVECEDDDRFFGASPERDDLVGSGGASSLVGIYKLIAVQQVEKYEKVRVTGTEFAPPEAKVLDIDLGQGGVSVAGEPAQIDAVGFDACFEEV